MAYFLQNFKNKQKRLKKVFLQNRGKIIKIREKNNSEKKGKNREKKNRKKIEKKFGFYFFENQRKRFMTD